ncbi:thiolase family protein [Microbacterium luticocti]|uniref:thiolase family protein n=1 Tax=Microbacterium luticocti TaxID=451764 RepID=UPI0004099E40|nr:thiolase family protein [Microbacterium luticocti]
MQREAVIVAAVRSPIGKRNGALSGMHPVDLGADVLTELAQRVDLDPVTIDDVVWGCVTTVGEQSSNVGRQSVLAAGWPDSIPAVTIDRACGSSQQALAFAAAGVIAGQYDIAVAGGVESMSRVPMGSTRDRGPGQARGDRVAQRYPGASFSQGEASDMIAARWHLERSAIDEYALRSHNLAARAQDVGDFADEIVPISTGGQSVVADEGVRRSSSMEALAKLTPVFSDGGVTTAGNSSQISDAAAALLVTTGEIAARKGWKPLARVHSSAVTAVDPVLMLTGPISATYAVLRRAGLSLGEIDTFEVNEAFASVVLAWQAETGADLDRVNPSGGAVALGHPLGCSGARLAVSLVHRMQREGHRYGLQAICEAGGMANAMVLERL